MAHRLLNGAHLILRYFFFLFLVRPLVYLVLGLNIRRGEHMVRHGPAIIAANHNSHLDTLVLMSLCRIEVLSRMRPVAAADYFLRNRLLAWFSQRVVGIIPIDRSGATRDPFETVSRALEEGAIIILFPEGTRGQPEELCEFKTGIAHLCKRHPEVPVYPVFMHGSGKALPKGEGLLVPFFIDVFLGEPITWCGGKKQFMANLEASFERLRAEGVLPEWE